MLNKMEFILLFNKIMNGETVGDDEFTRLIQVLQMQRLVGGDYVKDDSLTQAQNILKITSDNSLKFYEMYLGQ